MTNEITPRNVHNDQTQGSTVRLSQHRHALEWMEGGSFYEERGLNIRDLVEKLLKRKSLVLLVTLIVVVPVALATFLAPRLHRSTAVLQFVADRPSVLPYKDMTEGPLGGSYEGALKTQEQILKSPLLVERVAERLGEDTANGEGDRHRYLWAQAFEIRRIPLSELFAISWLAPDPDLAAKIVNLFTEEYIKQFHENRQAIREKNRQALEKELLALEKRLQLSEKDLLSYARDNNIVATDSGQDLVEKKLAAVDQRVGEAEAELAVARSRVAAVQRASIKEFPEKLATALVQNLTSNLLNLEHQLAALRVSYGENWPDVVQKRQEIAMVRDQLEREKSAVLAQAREQARMDLFAVESRHRMMSASLGEQRGLVNRFRDASIQYKILQREVETNRKLYEGLLERLKQTGVMAGLEFGNIQVIEPARPDPNVASPRVWWNLGIASLLGLALGVSLVFLIDFWKNAFASVEELEQSARLPALGAIPLISSPKQKRLRLFERWKKVLGGSSETGVRLLPDRRSQSRSPEEKWPDITEDIRGICASILLSTSDREPRVILVTSAEPGEGKTTLTGCLGKALAEHGFSTLMIEGDLRRPGLSKLFHVSGEEGLSLFLSGHVRPLPKIHETGTRNLWLVAGGPKPPNPVALLNSDRMASLLSEVSSLFKFVIIDSPPLMAVADARSLGPRCDGVVLIVRAGRTPRSLVLQASALLESSGANILGVVLNGAETSARSAYYHAYYQTTTPETRDPPIQS
ncbi:MAG: polysaccharide biosynthesis tyrosine autokinase [Acidobacteriota bacterium]